MRVLVIVASKHQATAGIGDAVVDELRACGHEAKRVAPGDVRSFVGIDAVVLGSAVYMTQWMESMRDFVAGRGEELRAMPLWVFSCGLAGVADTGAVQDPAMASALVRQLDPIGYVTFKGRLDPAALGLRERTVTRLGSAPEGDYREWGKIRAWARDIAGQLDRRRPAEPAAPRPAEPAAPRATEAPRAARHTRAASEPAVSRTAPYTRAV